MARPAIVKVARFVPVAALLAALPALAGSLAPGLPAHPSMVDYVRCSVRSFLVTPRPPARPKALPKGVEARVAGPRTPASSRI